jgi:hypothetical protein
MDWNGFITTLFALAVPVTAAITTYVAVAQWRVNHNRLRMEAYDRRVAVVRRVLDLIGEISITGKTTLDSLKAVTESGIPDFLFSKRDAAYLLTIRKKAMEVLARTTVEAAQANAGETPSSVARLEAVLWINEQEQEVIKRFRKYLSLPS